MLQVASLAVLVACGGKTGSSGTTPPAGGDGAGERSAAAVACEPGRCLEDISRLIAERKTDSRACYDTARKRDAKLAGKVVINFAIDSEGVVAETEQSVKDGQLEDAELTTCVSEVIKTVRFPASAGGRTTRAYHRFEFMP